MYHLFIYTWCYWAKYLPFPIPLFNQCQSLQITPEIRREITQSKSRDEEIPSEAIPVPMNFDD